MDDEEVQQTIKLYRDCSGIKSSMSVLCDASYIRFLYSREKDLTRIYDLHSEIQQAFRVDNVRLVTTWCVYQTVCNDDLVAGNQIVRRDGVFGYARRFPRQWCDHSGPVVDSTACLKKLIENAVLDPFFLASADLKFCKKIGQSTGVPILTVSNGNISVLPPEEAHMRKLKLNRRKRLYEIELSLKQQREIMATTLEMRKKEEAVKILKKRKRLLELDLAQKEEMKIKENLHEDEKKREKAVNKGAAASEGDVSEREIVKKKRNRKKAKEKAMNEGAAASAAVVCERVLNFLVFIVRRTFVQYSIWFFCVHEIVKKKRNRKKKRDRAKRDGAAVSEGDASEREIVKKKRNRKKERVIAKKDSAAASEGDVSEREIVNKKQNRRKEREVAKKKGAAVSEANACDKEIVMKKRTGKRLQKEDKEV